MDGVTENYSKFEVRDMVRFLKAEELSQIENHRRLVFKTKTFSVERKCLWLNSFKEGRTALNDVPEKHKIKPRTSHTDENFVIVEGLIKKNRRVKVSETHCKKKNSRAILHILSKGPPP
jgi:hypothetical protein